MDCRYNINDVDKIVEYTTWSDKRKIDTLLHINNIMYSNLGLDSSKQERSTTKQLSRKIYKAIKIVSPELGKSLLLDMES
jgi:CRISPR/Cas system CSM-associated protein Csm2 small subunit|tara:strand:+ start:330 stop:569 length:240 start_codon:yes stop_codon:yes gene_type:complete